MTAIKQKMAYWFSAILLLLLLLNSCAEKEKTELNEPSVFPLSDPDNLGGWTLNEEVSDEFEGDQLNEDKWLIQGKNGEYRSNFIGRAPSQFSTENVRLEDGKLKIQIKWDPDFDFSDQIQSYANGTSHKYENITTAAVVSKNYFYRGYMEIKCKVADVSVSNAFWMTGPQAELDVFEFIGNPAQDWKDHLKREYKFTIHDWSPEKGGAAVWSEKVELDWEVASGFHVYACEWDANNLKFYADGVLVHSTTKEELGDAWVLDVPLWVWMDVETFPWHGIPVEEDLPADFEIEYVRIWQKE